MKYFYIGCSRSKGNKIGSVLLQKYMGENFSHTFIEYDTMRGVEDNTIYHSTMSSGVGYWSNYQFEKINEKSNLYKVEVSDEMFKKIRIKIHKLAGGQYAWWQNIGITIVEIAQNMGYDIPNPFREHENCSELVFLALVELHPELKERYNQNTVRPDHIRDILEEYNYENLIKE